jgi:hypothetical protein
MDSNQHAPLGLKTPTHQQPETPGTLEGSDAPRHRLEVFVIFTNTAGTLAALQMADRLAKRLDARLRLLLPYEVPYTLPLTQPAVPLGFLEGQLQAVACKASIEISAHIFLCRDKGRTLRLILKPHSLVVIGGRKRWWPTQEQRLVSLLKKGGHHVVFAEMR